MIGQEQPRHGGAAWVVAIATAASLGFVVWLLVGQPGVPLADGGYSCDGLTAQVADGSVVAITREVGGAQVEAWSDAARAGSHGLEVTVVYEDGTSERLSCQAL